jgi:hypothetical protein
MAASLSGQIPARLAIEQTTAVSTVAATLGYDADAVNRAFRERYWRHERASELPHGRGVTR